MLSPRDTTPGKFGPAGARFMSFSGRERNHFLLGQGGRGFADYSYVAGLDAIQDGRTFAHADLDHDGDSDVVLISRNAPVLQIFRNDLAETNRFFGIEIFGDGERSNRDAIGARLVVRCGQRQIVRTVDGGSGFATRNATALTVGIGPCEKPDDITVEWPSGRARKFQSVEAGGYYEVAENGPLQRLRGFYARRDAAVAAAPAAAALPRAIAGARAHREGRSRAWKPKQDLVYLSLWASWCASCKREQPRKNRLAEAFGDRMDFAGLTIEEEDSPDMVARYAADHDIAYPVLSLPAEAHGKAIAEVEKLFGGKLPPLPAAVVIDRVTGAILFKELGVGTVSDLEQVLHHRVVPDDDSGPGVPLAAAVAFIAFLGVVLALQRRKRDPTPSE